MINTVFTGLLLAAMLFLVVFCVKFVSKMTRIYNDFVSFVTPKAENEPSEFAKFTMALAKQAGYAIAIEVKTTLMNKASIASRQESAIVADMVQDSASQTNPMAGALMEAFPKASRRIAKNPALMQIALNILSKAGGIGGSSTGGNNHSEQVKFKL